MYTTATLFEFFVSEAMPFPSPLKINSRKGKSMARETNDKTMDKTIKSIYRKLFIENYIHAIGSVGASHLREPSNRELYIKNYLKI